ncbi:hypothetical protein HY992_06185 [Candidatus Micrarchaeota archaeon]|nr:hypothetical protein [Candidatus Micrarchaeota archaeon]
MSDETVQVLAQATPSARQAQQTQGQTLVERQRRGGTQADFQQRHLNQTRVFADYLKRYEGGGWLARLSVARAIHSFFDGVSKEETSSLIRSLAETHDPLAWGFMKKYGGGAGGRCAHLLLFQSLKVMGEHNADDIIAFQLGQLSAEPDKTEPFLEATMGLHSQLENIFILKSMNTVLEKVDARVRDAFVERHDLHGMAIPVYDDTKKMSVGKTVSYTPKGRGYSTQDAILVSAFHVKRARLKGMNFTSESWIVDINHVLETAVWSFFRKLYHDNWITFTNSHNAPGVKEQIASLRSAAGWQGRIDDGLPYVLIEVGGQVIKIYVSLADMRADKIKELSLTYEKKTVDINRLSRIRSVEIPQEFITENALKRITALAASSILQQSQQLARNEAVPHASQTLQQAPQFFVLHANQVFIVSTSNFGAGLSISLSVFAHAPSLRNTTPKLSRGVNLFARVSGTGAVHELGSATGSIAYFDADFSSSGSAPRFSGGVIHSSESLTVKKNVEEFASDSRGSGEGAKEQFPASPVSSSASVFSGAVSFVEGVLSFVSGSVPATGVSGEKLKALPGGKEETGVSSAIYFSNAFKEKTPLSEAAHSSFGVSVESGRLHAGSRTSVRAGMVESNRLRCGVRESIGVGVSSEVRLRENVESSVRNNVSHAGVRARLNERVHSSAGVREIVGNVLHAGVREHVGARVSENVVLSAGVREAVSACVAANSSERVHETVGNVLRDKTVHAGVRAANEHVVLNSNVGARVSSGEILLKNGVREDAGVSRVGVRESVAVSNETVVHGFLVASSEAVHASNIACSEVVLSERVGVSSGNAVLNESVASALQSNLSESVHSCVPLDAFVVQASGFELEQHVGFSVQQETLVCERVESVQVEVVRLGKVARKISLKELKRIKVVERKAEEKEKKKKLGVEEVNALVRALGGKPPGGEGNRRKIKKNLKKLLELLNEGREKRGRKWLKKRSRSTSRGKAGLKKK